MKGPPARYEEPKEQFPAIEGIILDAGDLVPGDRVVYPNQGVCRVTGVEVKEIVGQRLELVRMECEEDGAAVLVPKGKVPTIGLRKVASGEQIEGVFHYLAAQYDDPELDWKVRHRDNADRLIAGGVLGVAEVVKGLHALSRIRPLPTKEREQYDNARHLLVHEVAVSLGVPPALAEDYIDYALMPPAGVTFKLKPPPKPVELPARPRRRPAAVAEDDLGLDDLGLELPVDGVAESARVEGEDGAEPAAGEEEGVAAPVPPAEELPMPSEAEEEVEEEPLPVRKAPAAAARSPREALRTPPERKAKKKAPAKKSAAGKAEAPAASRAGTRAPKKAAPARPGRGARKAPKASRTGAAKKPAARGSKKK